MSNQGSRRSWSGRSVVALAAAVATAPAGAQRIDTGTPPGAGTVTYPFGPLALARGGSTSNVAQTFVAPPGAATLVQFQFWLGNVAPILGGFENASFHAYVFAWSDGTSRIVGPALYQSPVQTGTSSSAATAYTFEVGTLTLTPGQRYAAVLSSLGTALPAGGGVGGVFLARPNVGLGAVDTYADGQSWTLGTLPFVNDPAALATGPWSGQSADLAFTATFVPEPSTLALAAAGGLALTVVAVRRRRA